MDGSGLARGVSPLRVLTSWFGGMAIGGAGFGLFAERKPFGDSVLGHPLVVFFALVALGLIVLRFAIERPVTDLISERALVAG